MRFTTRRLGGHKHRRRRRCFSVARLSGAIGLIRLVGLVGLIGLVGLSGLSGLIGLVSGAQDGPATLIIRNGPIYTANPSQPTAAAVAVRNARIALVGTDGDV